jgi:hypothetical protein
MILSDKVDSRKSSGRDGDDEEISSVKRRLIVSGIKGRLNKNNPQGTVKLCR